MLLLLLRMLVLPHECDVGSDSGGDDWRQDPDPAEVTVALRTRALAERSRLAALDMPSLTLCDTLRRRAPA